MQSRKTIYVRFDLNDYSIPPEAVGRPLTLVASDTDVRILDGAAEIARHRRCYDRQRLVLDPAHQQALLRTKRKALAATRVGRLAVAVPESEALLDRAFAAGESAGSQTAQLLQLLDLYGVALCAAPSVKPWNGILRAPLRSPSCCAGAPCSTPLPAIDLSRHPEAQAIDVRPHDLETYDELARPRDDDAEQ